jgi:hypothetical protein
MNITSHIRKGLSLGAQEMQYVEKPAKQWFNVLDISWFGKKTVIAVVFLMCRSVWHRVS